MIYILNKFPCIIRRFEYGRHLEYHRVTIAGPSILRALLDLLIVTRVG